MTRADVVTAIARSIVRLTPRGLRDRLVRESCQTLGITHLVHAGPLGAFEGEAKDRVVHAMLARSDTWEPDAQALLVKFFDAGVGTFIDVGANIGTLAIPAARYGATVHAVEPDPRNLACLHRNAERNGTYLRVHEFAAWDRQDHLRLAHDEHNGGDSRVLFLAPGEGVNVRFALLDHLIDADSLTGPVLMKMDVQGSEVRALRGARQLLEKTDALLIEVEPALLESVGNTLDELMDEIALRFPLAQVMGEKRVVSVFEAWERLHCRKWGTDHVDLLALKRFA